MSVELETRRDRLTAALHELAEARAALRHETTDGVGQSAGRLETLQDDVEGALRLVARILPQG